MVLNDIRLKRTIAAILKPSQKRSVNTRSLDFIKLVLCNKSDCVLFATFPKSGWNWTADILSYVVIKQLTGKYDVIYGDKGTLKERVVKPYRLFNPADSRTSSVKFIKKDFPALNLNLCLHTHGFWKQSPLWGLDDAKTVFIVRNIPTTLYSFYKSRGNHYASFEDCLKDGVFDRIINFYNSWGEFCTRHEHYRIFKYEDFKSDPVRQFQELAKYVFGLDIDDALMAEALDYYSIEKQKAREFQFCADESKHFHFQGQADYSNRISEQTLAEIYKKINAELQYKFGYEYPA